MIAYRKRALLMERIYNKLLNARDTKTEWSDWHARTVDDIHAIEKGAKQPLELSDQTNLRFYDWTSKALLKHVTLTPKSEILELGCGSGALSRQFVLKAGSKATLLDNEKVAIRYAKIICNDVNEKCIFVQGDAFNLALKDVSYDIVHSTGLIEHFDEQSIDKLISEHIRVLKPGGYAYILVPNFYAPYMLNIWRKYRKNTERFITPSRLAHYAKRFDVAVVDKGATRFAFHNTNPLSKITAFESFIGHRLGLGFLNYIILKKNNDR